MKKFLSVILCAIMILPAIPITVGAEPSYDNQYEHLYYTKYDDHIEITGCDENAESVNIPAEIDGLPVTEIGEYAFYVCSSLTSITIPDSVTSIGTSAFFGCNNLKNINIPNSVMSIGSTAFNRCGNLNITVDKNNPNYSDIDGVLFNKDKTEIMAYSKDKIQPEYSIPYGVTSIGDYAFFVCYDLASVSFPSSVTSIGRQAFDYCGSLNIMVDKNNPNYSDIDGVFFDKSKTEIIIYAKDKIQPQYTIPDGVISICDNAFSTCEDLKSVTIPNSVETINNGAFKHCGSLNITVGENNPKYSDIDGVLFNKDKTEIIVYAKDEMQPEYSIPDSVTSIGYSAFEWCSSLTSVTIPSSVTSIGFAAFFDCSSLKDVYYGGSKEDWQNINNIDSVNNVDLVSAHIHYNSDGHPQISVSEPVVEGGSITITAETKNIEGVGEMFAVGYDGNKLTASEKLQDGAATLPAEDVQTIKVFCWDSLDTMRPLCEPKTITIK